MITEVKCQAEKSIVFSVHAFPSIWFDESKCQVIYDSQHYFWLVEINLVTKTIRRKINPDCPDSPDEIIENIRRLSGYRIKKYSIDDISCPTGIGFEIRKLLVIRSLSVGKIEPEMPSIEILKNLFLMSIIKGYNCLGYQDC